MHIGGRWRGVSNRVRGSQVGWWIWLGGGNMWGGRRVGATLWRASVAPRPSCREQPSVQMSDDTKKLKDVYDKGWTETNIDIDAFPTLIQFY